MDMYVHYMQNIAEQPSQHIQNSYVQFICGFNLMNVNRFFLFSLFVWNALRVQFPLSIFIDIFCRKHKSSRMSSTKLMKSINPSMKCGVHSKRFYVQKFLFYVVWYCSSYGQPMLLCSMDYHWIQLVLVATSMLILYWSVSSKYPATLCHGGVWIKSEDDGHWLDHW